VFTRCPPTAGEPVTEPAPGMTHPCMTVLCVGPSGAPSGLRTRPFASTHHVPTCYPPPPPPPPTPLFFSLFFFLRRSTSDLGKILSERNGQPLDAVFVCCGGGGLLAGIGAYIKSVRPEVRVIGVEAEDAAGMTASLQVRRTSHTHTFPHSLTPADPLEISPRHRVPPLLKG